MLFPDKLLPSPNSNCDWYTFIPPRSATICCGCSMTCSRRNSGMRRLRSSCLTCRERRNFKLGTPCYSVRNCRSRRLLGQAGDDEDDADLVGHVLAGGGAEDDVGLVAGELVDGVHGMVDVHQAQA